MASKYELLETYEKITQCRICYKRITDPRTLKCDHSFCKECLESRIMFLDFENSLICCPVCRQNHMLDEDETVFDLKASNDVVEYIDLLSKMKPVPRPRHKSVFQCKNEDCVEKMESFCKSCFCFTCGSCHYPEHREFIQPVKYNLSTKTFESYCVKHHCIDKYICLDCSSSYICTYCKIKHHDEHKVISVEELQESIPMTHLKTELNFLTNSLEENKKIIYSNEHIVLQNNVDKLKQFLSTRKIDLLQKYLVILNNEEKEILSKCDESAKMYKEKCNKHVQELDKQMAKNNLAIASQGNASQLTHLELVYGRLDAITFMKDHLQSSQQLLQSTVSSEDFEVYLSEPDVYVKQRQLPHKEKSYQDIIFSSNATEVDANIFSSVLNTKIDLEEMQESAKKLQNEIVNIQTLYKSEETAHDAHKDNTFEFYETPFNEHKYNIHPTTKEPTDPHNTNVLTQEIDLESSLSMLDCLSNRKVDYLAAIAELEEENTNNENLEEERYILLKEALTKIEKLSRNVKRGMRISMEEIPSRLPLKMQKCRSLPAFTGGRTYAINLDRHGSCRNALPKKFKEFTPTTRRMILERRELQYIIQATIYRQNGSKNIKQKAKLLLAEAKKCQRLLESQKRNIELDDVMPVQGLDLWRPPQDLQHILEVLFRGLQHGYETVINDLAKAIKNKRPNNEITMREDIIQQYRDLMLKLEAVIDTDFKDPILSLGYRPKDMQVMLAQNAAANPLYSNTSSTSVTNT